MKRILKFIEASFYGLLFILSISLCHADTVTVPTTYQTNGQVTSSNLNGNFSAITAGINGGLDNNNANTSGGYRFFETKSSLPSAGSQGRIVFLTSDNSLNVDTGAAWQQAIFPSGTVATGKIPYYSSGWQLLTPGTQYYSLVSNGASSNPSYQVLDPRGGGTGISSYTIGDLLYASSSTALSSLAAGTNGYVLKSNGAGAAPSWQAATADTNTSNTIFSFAGQTNVQGTAKGFYTGTSLTNTASAANYSYWQTTTTASYDTLIRTKWTKIAGVSTVTFFGLIWSSGGGDSCNLQVDIGGASNAVNGGTTGTPTWTAGTAVNVSGLSNGTTYDVVIQLKAGATICYLGSIAAFGS